MFILISAAFSGSVPAQCGSCARDWFYRLVKWICQAGRDLCSVWLSRTGPCDDLAGVQRLAVVIFGDAGCTDLFAGLRLPLRMISTSQQISTLLLVALRPSPTNISFSFKDVDHQHVRWPRKMEAAGSRWSGTSSRSLRVSMDLHRSASSRTCWASAWKTNTEVSNPT